MNEQWVMITEGKSLPFLQTLNFVQIHGILE